MGRNTFASTPFPSINRIQRLPRIATSVLFAIGLAVAVPVLKVAESVRVRTEPYSHPLLHPASRPNVTASPRALSIADVQQGALVELVSLLLALALLLLAIALVGLLSILLTLASVRRGEMALRSALGATMARLARTTAGNVAPWVLAGTLSGLTGIWLCATALAWAWPDEAPPWANLGMDWKTAGFVWLAVALVAFTGWLAPIGVARTRNLARHVGSGGRVSASPGAVLARNALVVGQIAAALTLLLTGGLLVRAFGSSSETGAAWSSDPSHITVFQLHAPPHLSSADRGAFYARAVDAVRRVPGVVDTSLATAGSWVGVGEVDWVTTVCEDCSQAGFPKPISQGPSRIHAVSPGFFQAMDAPPLRGRELLPSDAGLNPSEAVINLAFAYRLFPNGEPLGKIVQLGGASGGWYTIVGVVSEMRAQGIGARADPVPAIYLSALAHAPRVIDLAVRVREPTDALGQTLQPVIQRIHAGAQLGQPMSMNQYLAAFAAPLSWFGGLLALLALLSLVLAGAGVYAVISFGVSRRIREIGTRVAIGATPSAIRRLVLGQSLRLVAWGSAIGLMAALGVARLLQLSLNGVRVFDPLLFGIVTAALGCTALLAALRPASRAARVDANISLSID